MKSVQTCQHKIRFVLTFTQNDLTLVEIYTVLLHFGLDTCQIKLEFVQDNTKSAGKCHMSAVVISCSNTGTSVF